jgi:site-specific DNA recombinase
MKLIVMILKQVYQAIASEDNDHDLSNVKKQLEEFNTRITKARDKMLNDVILDFEYRKIKSECENNISILEGKLIDLSRGKENIGDLIRKATKMTTNLSETYLNADSEGKRRIISSMYPQKLTFDGEQHRTIRMNEAIRVLGTLKAVFEGKKKGQIKQKLDLPTMVAGSRIELPTSGL